MNTEVTGKCNVTFAGQSNRSKQRSTFPRFLSSLTSGNDCVVGRSKSIGVPRSIHTYQKVRSPYRICLVRGVQ